MLPMSPKKLLTSWLNLLINFRYAVCSQAVDLEVVKQSWQEIQTYLQSEIVPFELENLSTDIRTQWQMWQTETYRYIRLLNTELSFWRSSKQVETKKARHLSLTQKLNNTIVMTEKLLENNSNPSFRQD